MNAAPSSTPASSAPLGPGAFIAVMGPSGSGKDTLIAYAKARTKPGDVLYVRRVVTRAADSGAEDHDTMSEAEFRLADSSGEFALSWPAHGLLYGLPCEVDQAISNGRAVVANVSRAVLPLLQRRYAHVVAVSISASAAILAERIALRGRESGSAIAARLKRDPGVTLDGPGVVAIDNGGAVEIAGAALVAAIERAIAAARSGTV